MTEHARIEVHRGKRYRLVVHPTVETTTPVLRRMPSAKPRRRAADDRWCVPRWHLYDAGAQVIQTARYPGADPTDLANAVREIRLETSPNPPPFQLDQIRQLLLASARAEYPPPTYLYSGRTMYSRAPALAATPEVSGYNLVTTLRRLPLAGQAEADRIVWQRGVQYNAPWVARQRTPAEQLATWDALEPDAASSTHAEWRRVRDRLELLQLEKWTTDSAGRAQADLTVRSVGVTPGLYVPSMIGGDIYHSWDPENRADFNTVRSDWAYDPASSGPPLATCGVGQQTDMTCFLMPRRHRFVARWTALFVVVVLFAPPILISEVNTLTFSDRLPLDFSTVNSPGQLQNDVALSHWISRSNRYAVAIQQDAASEVVSPYFVKLLLARIDGIWAVHVGREHAGDLAAVIDMKRGERTDTYRLFRRTDVDHEDRLLDEGSLNTQEVSGLAQGADATYGGYSWGSL